MPPRRRTQPRSSLSDALNALDSLTAPPPSAVLQSLDADDDSFGGSSPFSPTRIGMSSGSMTADAAFRALMDDDGASPPTKPKRTEATATATQSGQLAASALKSRSAGSLRSESQTDSETRGGNNMSKVFLSELELFHKRAEEEADRIVFEAESLARAASGRPLHELMAHLTVAPGILSTLRKLGHAARFVDCCAARPLLFSRASRVAHVVVLRYLTVSLPREAVASRALIATVLQLMRSDGGAGHLGSPVSPPQVATATTTHWSTRATTPALAPRSLGSVLFGSNFSAPTPPSPAADSSELDAQLLDAAAKMAKIDRDVLLEGATLPQLCIEVLTHAVLSGNREDDAPFGPGPARSHSGSSGSSPLAPLPLKPLAPVALLNGGGFADLLALLESEATDVALFRQVVQLLDVATCCTALAEAASSKGDDGPLATFATLLRLLVRLAHTPRAGMDDDDVCRMLRVGMNITTLWPQVAPADPIPSRDFANEVKAVMSRGEDVIVCAACLLINVLKSGENAALRWELLDDAAWLQRIAESVVSLRQGDDAADNVTAGYLAMVLGILSLDDESARVRVLTALSRAYNDDRIAHKPMMLVVAILQEFVMFQSQAGILTREALISLHRVIERLIAQNNINVHQQDEPTATD